MKKTELHQLLGTEVGSVVGDGVKCEGDGVRSVKETELCQLLETGVGSVVGNGVGSV